MAEKRKYTRKKPAEKEADKSETLEQIMIDENIPKAVGESGELRVITTSEIKPRPKNVKSASYKPEDDVIITASDFKPRKWGNVKKL